MSTLDCYTPLWYNNNRKGKWYLLTTHELEQQTYDKLTQVLNEISYNLVDEHDEEIIIMIDSLGYATVVYESKTLMTEKGPVVMTQDTTFNNGIYILRNDNGAYLLEVLIPNNIDKSTLVTKTTQIMNHQLSQVDVSDLEIYDLTQAYAHVVVSQVVKPLAKHIYPDHEENQQKFINIYLPRFLANMARYYMGDDKLMEEAVNSEPHIVKIMISGTDTIQPTPEQQKG